MDTWLCAEHAHILSHCFLGSWSRVYREETGSEWLGIWPKATQLTRDTAPFSQLQVEAAAAACASCSLIRKGSSQGRGREKSRSVTSPPQWAWPCSLCVRVHSGKVCKESQLTVSDRQRPLGAAGAWPAFEERVNGFGHPGAVLLWPCTKGYQQDRALRPKPGQQTDCWGMGDWAGHQARAPLEPRERRCHRRAQPGVPRSPGPRHCSCGLRTGQSPHPQLLQVPLGWCFGRRAPGDSWGCPTVSVSPKVAEANPQTVVV